MVWCENQSDLFFDRLDDLWIDFTVLVCSVRLVALLPCLQIVKKASAMTFGHSSLPLRTAKARYCVCLCPVFFFRSHDMPTVSDVHMSVVLVVVVPPIHSVVCSKGRTWKR